MADLTWSGPSSTTTAIHEISSTSLLLRLRALSRREAATVSPTPAYRVPVTSATRAAIRCSGRNFRQFDFSIFKDTAITEHVKLELRFEAYNMLNHPNFISPLLPSFIADAAPNGVGPDGRHIGTLRLTATADMGIGYPFLGAAALADCRLRPKSPSSLLAAIFGDTAWLFARPLPFLIDCCLFGVPTGRRKPAPPPCKFFSVAAY